MSYFNYDGKSSADYGLIIGGGATYNAPERDITLIEIPGRNGSLTIDNGRFKNVAVRYPFEIISSFPANAASLRGWLLQKPGYRKLYDSYDTDHYRMARFTGPMELTTSSWNMYGKGTIEFDCMPQRFLNSGDTSVEITASGYTLTNPTLYDALPLIKVEGSGNITLSVGGYTVGITGLTSSVTIDCELQDAYNGSQNMNSIISVLNYPKLGAGDNVVGWTGSVTKVTITPRWWTV